MKQKTIDTVRHLEAKKKGMAVTCEALMNYVGMQQPVVEERWQSIAADIDRLIDAVKAADVAQQDD